MSDSLFGGAGTSITPSSTNVSPAGIIGTTAGSTGAASALTAPSDFRARLAPLSASVYGTVSTSNILNPLNPATKGMNGQPGTGGVLFPFTPSMQEERSVEYAAASISGGNMDYMAYQRTPSVALTVTGKFSVQNQMEGEYAMAAIHFFRVVSKSYFGLKAGDMAGLPPPMLVFSAYGNLLYGSLKVIMRSSTFTPQDCDWVPVTTALGVVRLPALFELSCSLLVQQTPSVMVNQFDLSAFTTGALLQQGGWI